MKTTAAPNDGLIFRSGIHYISVLETGCQELEALLKLVEFHHKAGQATQMSGEKAVFAATTDAVCQLACIKTYALLFDNTRKVASLYNLRGEDPLHRGSDDLVQRACEVVMLSNSNETDLGLTAQRVPIDEVIASKPLCEINIERSDALKTGHDLVLETFAKLEKEALTWDLKKVRDLWLAHTSLEADKWMYVHQFHPQLLVFLQKCAATLRLAVETYKPAVFVRNGRHTWHKINELAQEQPSKADPEPI
jgi:hypothetical protein